MKVTQGIYEHYKSTADNPKYYQVLMLSHFEETLETLVHYTPLYFNNDNDIYNDGVAVWTRTLKNFTEDVKWNGKILPRFQKAKRIARI
jgi:hypothetical protein